MDRAIGLKFCSGTVACGCAPTLTLWTPLTRFMEHLELELSNNLAENSMRPVALDAATGYTSEARKLDRALQPSSRSSKPADDSKSRFATIFARSCRAWQISRSNESLNLPLAPGRLELTVGIRRWNHRAVGKTDTAQMAAHDTSVGSTQNNERCFTKIDALQKSTDHSYPLAKQIQQRKNPLHTLLCVLAV